MFVENFNKIISLDTKVIKYFWGGHKSTVTLMILMTVISGFIEMLNVAVLLPMIQAGALFLDGSEHVENIGVLNNLLNWIMFVSELKNPLLASSLLVITVSFTNFCFKLLYTYFIVVKIEKIYLGVKSDVFKLLKSAEYLFYTSIEHGVILHKTAVAPDSILSGTTSIVRLFNDIITITFLLIMMVLASADMMLLIAAVGIIYFVISKKIVSWLVKDKAKEAVQLRQDDMHLIGQFVSGIKPIKLYTASNKWEDKYNSIAKRYTLLQRYISIGFALPAALIQLLLGFGIGGAGFYLVLSGSGADSIAILGMFVVAANRLNGSITGAINNYTSWVYQYPLIEDLYKLLTTVKTNKYDYDESNPIIFENNIEIKNVCYTYPARTDATLKNISLTIRKNRTVGIVGGSGGGKSTLLNIILRLFQPSHGQILIDEESVNNFSLKEYWKLFGLVSQDTFLLNASIRDNILFGEREVEDSLINAAKMADIDVFIESLPNGYETIVGENGVQLSGGQKQRISIARALLRNPPILVLDEPTSALDIDTEQTIMKTINSFAGGRTIIMVAHRFSTIKDADEIVVMDNGNIIDVGSHEILMERNSRYRRMYMSNIVSS